MTETNRIEYKRELTSELDIEKEVVAFLVFCVHTVKIVLSLQITLFVLLCLLVCKMASCRCQVSKLVYKLVSKLKY